MKFYLIFLTILLNMLLSSCTYVSGLKTDYVSATNKETSDSNNGTTLKKSFENVAVIETGNYVAAKSASKIYYVSATNRNASDSNNGTTLKTPFKTLQKAADVTKPGDTVYIMNGTYTASNSSSVVTIKRSGTPNAWIKYKAYPGHKPKLKHLATGTWNGILIERASYIEIEGLEIEGNNKKITLRYAQQKYQDRLNPLTNGNCISIDGRKVPNANKPHHIKIVKNKVHDCGGGGISAIQSDYITVDRNQVYNNAWYSVYANSGISIYQPWNSNSYIDNYKIVITNNNVYNNRQYIPWIAVGKITDGNGIILDDYQHTQNNSTLGAYKGKTLVANNIVYKNGGAGIHSFLSNNVDIVNNTAYMNNQTPHLKGGQIIASRSNNVQILNNIMYAYPGKNVNSNIQNKNVVYDYNIYFNSNKIFVKGKHDIIANPRFLDPDKGNFKVHPMSPAIDRGTRWTSIRYDFQCFSRVINKKQDIGAIEFRPVNKYLQIKNCL